MTTNEEKMIETLEEARKSSEHSRFPVYAYSNGERITFVAEYNRNALEPYLTKEGYWICSIFENGHRVEA